MMENRKTYQKKGIRVGIISFVAMLLGAAITSTKIVLNVVKPKTIDYYEHYNKEILNGGFDEADFHKWKKDEFYIDSDDGLLIHGFFFPNGNSKKTIIVLHGITMSLWSSIKYGEIFYKQGFNVCVYDHPNHGLSEGSFTSVGVKERYVTARVIDYVVDRVGEGGLIGLHGESMGSGTAMMAIKIDKRINFVIEDCGYSTIKEELTVRLKEEYRLPAFPFLLLSNFIVKLVWGFDLFKESPLDAVKNSIIPILFIHGSDDTYVPTFMVYELYKVKSDKKEVHVFNQSKHACSYIDHKVEYERVVVAFLEKYGFC